MRATLITSSGCGSRGVEPLTIYILHELDINLVGEAVGYHGLDIRINVVWDMTPCSLAGTYRRFIVYSSLYHQAHDNL